MIVKSISHEQRKKAAKERGREKKRGEQSALKRVTARAQAEHVIAASVYMMSPTKARARAAGLEDHLVERTMDYLVNDEGGRERVLCVAHQNFRSDVLAEQQAEMIALMTTAPGPDDPFEHLMLSPGHGIVPTEAQMRRVPKRLLERLGTSGHLAFVVWHADTANIHAHIGLCRSNPETGQRVQLGDRWMLDTIGQAIAAIEYEEGWAAEPNAPYRGTEAGVVRVATGELVRDALWNQIESARRRPTSAKEESTHEVKLTPGAEEYEKRHGLWSDERAAQMIAWPIIRKATSWDQLHRELADAGIVYEKRGSGAQIVLGDRTLSASKANWAASIAKLERLGKFEPRGHDVLLAQYQPRTLNDGDARVRHREAKANAARELAAERQQIRQGAAGALKELTAENQRLQTIINDASWSGRADELMLARKIVGLVHRVTRDAVEDNRRAADALARQHHRFPKFEPWLRDGWLGPSEEDDYDPDQADWQIGVIVGAPSRHRRPNVLLPDYETEDRALERRYLRDGRLRFVDHGNRVDVHDHLDRETVRDALLVAAEKWDAVQVTGGRKFMELAASLAAELNISLANPELQTLVIGEKTRLQRVRDARVSNDSALDERAKDLVRQWPLVREQNDVVLVGKETRDRFGLSVDEMLRPSFQNALRRQLERQKAVMGPMLADLARKPSRFRDQLGRIAIPHLGDGADYVRQQNWQLDKALMRELEVAVLRAEAGLASAAATNSIKGSSSPAVRSTSNQPGSSSVTKSSAGRATETAARHSEPGTIVPSWRMRGWNGKRQTPDEWKRLRQAADARLAEGDWDPAEYPGNPGLHALAPPTTRQTPVHPPSVSDRGLNRSTLRMNARPERRASDQAQAFAKRPSVNR